MKKFLKFCVAGFVLLAVLAGGVGWMVQTKWFLTGFIPRVLNERLPGIRIARVEITSHTWHFPCQVVVEDLHLVLEKEKEQYVVDCRHAHLENAAGIGTWKLHTESCDVYSQDVKGQDIDLNLMAQVKTSGLEKLDGQVRAKELTASGYALTDVRANVLMRGKEIFIDDIKGQLYGGRLQGKASIENAQDSPYQLALDLEEVSLKKLQQAWGEAKALAGIQGDITGHVELSGKRQAIYALSGNLNMARGAQLKASWLEFLIERLPANSTQRRELEGLVKSGGDVFFEKVSLSVQNVTAEKIVLNVAMESQQFNLKVNNQIDVNLDGGLAGLGEYLKYFK